MTSKTKFVSLVCLVALSGLLYLSEDWVFQFLTDGRVDLTRALSQIAMVAAVIILLWDRCMPGFVLALVWTAGQTIIFSYELWKYLTLWRAGAGIPTVLMVLSLLEAMTACVALVLLIVHYSNSSKRAVD